MTPEQEKALALARARRRRAEAEGKAPEAPNVAKDMAAAGAAGAARGTTGMLDLPGMIFGAGSRAGSWVAEKTGLASPEDAQAAHQMVTGAADATRFGSGDKYRQAAAEATGGATEFRGETTAGKYAGTVGEFLPGSPFGGGNLLRNALVYGVVPGLASEGAGQLTEGTAYEPWARAIAPMVASGAAAALTRPRGPQAPSVDDLKAQAEGLYQTGAARAGADPASVQGLANQIDNELQALNVKTPAGRVVADGNVKKFLDVLDDFQGQSMKPQQMQTMRRMLQDAAGSADPADRRIGAILLEKFDDWRGQHVPEYKQADALYGRMKRAKDVDWRIEKAENRAGSTGTGGNQVNAARQNIRQILDDPKKMRGYSPEELEAMRAIVRGDRTTNALRTVSRLSPGSGGWPLMANALLGGGAIYTSNPLLMAPMAAGAFAQGASEVLTRGQINALSAMIRNGGPVARNALADADRAAAALLAGRSINASD
ncbi:hypothetical protein LO749_12055 [Paracoccus denitrificans]|uniref:hypothetical protein n=1 Tax=Paracoccus denitrificans TaxID=266 RepID=UPI001E39728C|nr:hypothetical protein [Paracoccus denitrificans]UFS64867.1 hypothetical protein LO749_12055 [Paracoccus denitrificans]